MPDYPNEIHREIYESEVKRQGLDREVRTTSSTGGEKGVKPERYDLLPKEGLDAMARVYAFGATKYADHNWRRGYEWSKSIAAAMRHMMAFADGETNDPESGEPHPAHAMFHMAALLTWLEEQGEGETNLFDDRWPFLMERARQAKEESAAEEEARLLAEDEGEIGYIPVRYASDVPPGDGDLTDEEPPLEKMVTMADAEGLTVEEWAALNDIALPFGPDLLGKRRPMERNVEPHFTVHSDGTIYDNTGPTQAIVEEVMTIAQRRRAEARARFI